MKGGGAWREGRTPFIVGANRRPWALGPWLTARKAPVSALRGQSKEWPSRGMLVVLVEAKSHHDFHGCGDFLDPVGGQMCPSPVLTWPVS